ncbi:MAG: VTT domain-containing protein [archaeon]
MSINKIQKIKFGVLIALIVACLGAAVYLHVEGIEFKITEIGDYQYAPLYFILFYVAISFIPIPIAPIMFVGGFIFPFFQAVIFTLFGSIIFATISFYITRWLGRDYYEYLESKNQKLQSLDLKLRHDPFENLLLLRMFFIIPGEVINVYAGLSKIKFKDFITSTIIASTPLIMCCIGIIRARLLHDWVGIIISSLGLVLMLIIPIMFSPRIQRKIKKMSDRLKNF